MTAFMAGDALTFAALSSPPLSGPRVLHLVSGTFVGGGQVGALELTQYLQVLGLARTKLGTLGKPNPFFASVNPVAVPEYDGRYDHLRVVFRTVRALRRLIRRECPDILHTHGWDADVLGALALRRLPVRHVSHIRSLPQWAASARMRHRVRVAVTRWALRGSRATFVSVSEAARRYACERFGWRPDSVHVVMNGVDLARFDAISKPIPQAGRDGRLILGVAARLGEEKGLAVLLQALTRLDVTALDLEVRIAGEGRLRGALQALAEELGIGQRVRFLGRVEDMPEFYRGLDLFVLPSWTEGMPRTVLEAMASGVPVVATAVGGTGEALRDGVDGLLVPAGDTGAMAQAINRLAAAPALRWRMGQNGRCRIEECRTVQHVAQAVAKVYREMK